VTISRTGRPGSFAPTQGTLGASETGSIKRSSPYLISSNSSFPTPHRGQIQSSGRAENGVPGFPPLSGSPTAGSYTYAHTMHIHLVFLAIAMLLSGDGECADYIVPVEWPTTGYRPSHTPGSPRIRPFRRRPGGRPSRPGGEGTASPAPRRWRDRPPRDRTRTRTPCIGTWPLRRPFRIIGNGRDYIPRDEGTATSPRRPCRDGPARGPPRGGGGAATGFPGTPGGGGAKPGGAHPP